ncbi:MAG TPA: glycine--tRNA ligase subunit beta [Caulobacteraceae bacterium]|nr:glycine--tRNA ligase subunit beta [Caulobacteraceae bacterium]
MPQLLLELLSEEIPARFQEQAADDLDRLARAQLEAAGLAFDELRAFAGPRRLTLVADGVPSRQADREEVRKGPRVGAPEAAVSGFLRSAGVERDDLVVRDGVYFAVQHRRGRPACEAVPEMVEAMVRRFPWGKSMTWGEGSLRWVRPLQRILLVFDREVIALDLDGLAAGDLSEGHRFMGSRQPFRARDFDEYREALSGHFVVLGAEERKARILEGARAACAQHGVELIEDAGLLEENAGLAEWPTPIFGDFDASFLSLPSEVIRTSMRTHQRCFSVRSSGGLLAPHFVAVANIEARDGGRLIAAGVARVLAARLADARFFYEEDRKAPLERRLERLDGMTFHAGLGSMRERALRLEKLAGAIAKMVGADAISAARAGRLAKADLASSMVGEFPELQGVMGGYYALEEEGPEIAAAIRDHYRPQGPDDAAPSAPVSIAVALADKADMLAGFFGVGERPSGSRDPYGLRRAALGIVRVVLDNRLRTPLRALFDKAAQGYERRADTDELLGFMAERLKVALRDSGRRHDLVDAVFGLGDDDLVRLLARLEALDAFLRTPEGTDLLTGYRRAANILAAEAKKGGLPPPTSALSPDPPPAEARLSAALGDAVPTIEAALAAEDFVAAMSALAALRRPLDAFFDQVLVNSPVAAERAARLALLARVRNAMGLVADFARISG